MKKLSLFSAALFLLSFSVFAAEEKIQCENDFGKCEVGSSSVSCQCSNGMGFGSSSSDTVSSSSENEEVIPPTKEDCIKHLENGCGKALACENSAGKCIEYGSGRVECECFDPGRDHETEEGSVGEETMPGCGTSEDCEEDYSCIDNVCLSPEESKECYLDEDCPSGYACVIKEDSPENDGSNNSQPSGRCVQEPEESSMSCPEKLVAKCGDTAPSMMDYCNADSLKYCVEVFEVITEKCSFDEDKLTEMTAAEKEALLNNEWSPALSPYITECCKDVDDDGTEEIDELLTCIDEKGCDNCRGGNSGEDYETTGEPGTHDDGKAADENDSQEGGEVAKKESSSSGCSIVLASSARNSDALLIFLLLGLIVAARAVRKNR